MGISVIKIASTEACALVAPCSYMIKKYPYRDELLQNAEVLDIAKREETKVTQWLHSVNRFLQFLCDKGKEQIKEEFCGSQSD